MVRIATRTARTASKGNGMVGDYDRLRRRGHIISLSHKAVPLYSELPRRVLLGNSKRRSAGTPLNSLVAGSAHLFIVGGLH